MIIYHIPYTNSPFRQGRRIGSWLLLLLLTTTLSQAQELMTAADAVKIGLEHNFSVQILRNQELIASNNNTRGNAGMLPTIATTNTASYAISNTEQKFFSGDSRGAKDARSINFRFGMEVNWTAFDGFRMYVERDRLTALEQQSRAQTIAQMQNLAADILSAYYNLVQLERSTENLRYAVRLDRDLLQLVENKKRIGTATGLELLQSEARLTADSVRLHELETQIARTRMNFNQLLNRPVETAFDVDTILASNLIPGVDELLARSLQSNPAIQLQKIDRQLSALNSEMMKGAKLPELSLQSTLNFGYTRNDVGFLLSNRNFGPTIGLTLRYTIYDGDNRNREIANARISEENARIREADLNRVLEAQVRNSYADYQSLRQLSVLEQRNLEVAREQATLARELYRLGRTTNYEVREATLQEIQAQDRVIQTMSRLKQTEINLLDLAGIPLYSSM